MQAPITAEYIAQAFLSRDPVVQNKRGELIDRLEKAKLTAKRFRIDWQSVELLIKARKKRR